MSLSIEFPDLPSCVWHLDLWIPPVKYWERKKSGGIVKVKEMLSQIVALARHRTTRQGHAYEPEKNKAEKTAIRIALYDALERNNISIDSLPWPGPVAMVVMGHFPRDGRFRWWPGRPMTMTPDVTNMAKQIEDALAPNLKGEIPFPGAYKNDQSVVLSVSSKEFSEIAGTSVRLLFLDGEMCEPRRAPVKRRAAVKKQSPGHYSGAAPREGGIRSGPVYRIPGSDTRVLASLIPPFSPLEERLDLTPYPQAVVHPIANGIDQQ